MKPPEDELLVDLGPSSCAAPVPTTITWPRQYRDRRLAALEAAYEAYEAVVQSLRGGRAEPAHARIVGAVEDVRTAAAKEALEDTDQRLV